MAPPAQEHQFVHPEAAHAMRRAPSLFVIPPIYALGIFFVTALFAALFNPIQDCDETFNFWEPTHYLSHGYGLQTWEWSPEYGIRDWLYIAPHAILSLIRRLGEFYFVRYVLAAVCALCQTILYRVITLTIHPRIGAFFILATVLSAGNFHASTAYVPSSFTMYTGMLGAAAFMTWEGAPRTAAGIAWFAAGGIIGWPFAMFLCAPFLLEEALFVAVSLRDSDRFLFAAKRIFQGCGVALLILAADSLVNSYFYRKPGIVVAWNIIDYNVLSKGGGPNLYGTEPWTFYFKNLTLNFNLWFLLSLVALPLFALQKIFAPSGRGFSSGLRTVVFLSPFYIWFGLFTLQPHKEERFMYPAYPFLALNAAVSAHILLTFLGHISRRTVIGKIPAKIRLLGFVVVPFLLVVSVTVLRIIGVYTAYGAPLSLYEPLGAGVRDGQIGEVGERGDFVCYGKEWYRFPTSYFLPRQMQAKFIRSEFRGLLPGEFAHHSNKAGLLSGTWMIPEGMNDRNEEDMGKYTDIGHCNFLVDTQYPLNMEKGLTLPPNEPDYVADTDNWEVVKCLPFLDAGNTGLIPRMLYVPAWSFIPEKFQRKWGQHCLLRRRAPAMPAGGA
ncbi:family 22 glycosyltransferase [Cryphonectria parasitica EP155]|uniref:Mannosyltransferase n=1 Tax=Cryphonectria parasitica (strain ATCC 38755 / EP155) TaxID=660469 RepID=A0A9P5CQT8_CRYP1|nr:family 22 glycosyltransferase [Cryphonectria parasitica EP155]KAF3767553.1 family 22 glycosyltransferase [Cryphonectria parasitica EP155]